MDRSDITFQQLFSMPLGERITGITTYDNDIFITTEDKLFRVVVQDNCEFGLIRMSGLDQPR